MIDVIARKGIRVPEEDNPTRYITDDAPVSVADSVYYQRRLKDGDLLHVTVRPADESAEKSVAAAAKAEK